MTKPLRVGDLVTIGPPFFDDPIIVSLQPHGRVAVVLPPEGDEAQYLVVLLAAYPLDKRYGPFPAWRLGPGPEKVRS